MMIMKSDVFGFVK